MDPVTLQLSKQYTDKTIQGAGGLKGEDGTTFTPSVSGAGVLSWTNDGGLPNPEPVNIKGPPGVGVPTGGTIGQVLAKASDTDYDTHWVNQTGGGGANTYLVRAPVGTIVIWSGTADNIPTSWQLCDGTNGTPDLRDKFVLGAGISHSVGETGGSETVTLTVDQMPEHSHDYKIGYLEPGGTPPPPGTDDYPNTSFEASRNDPVTESGYIMNAGASQPHPNMPPYYTLCYIMKLTADPNDSVTVEEMNEAIETAITGAMEEAY